MNISLYFGRAHEDEQQGQIDAEKGNSLPEKTTEAYRAAYVESVRNMRSQIKSERRRGMIVGIIQSTAISLLPFYFSTFFINPMIQDYKAREQRIISYYQAHGACPHDLDAKGVDARCIMWNMEVELKCHN